MHLSRKNSSWLSVTVITTYKPGKNTTPAEHSGFLGMQTCNLKKEYVEATYKKIVYVHACLYTSISILKVEG